MSELGIVSCGAYVPILRLQRSAILAANGWFNSALKGASKGERAIANWDEDAITMGVEAARDALTGRSREPIATVLLASTTAPFADRQNSVIVKEALNLADTVATADLAGSQRAGLSALAQALGAVALSGRPALCIASEKRQALPASEGEMSFADAAAAVLVGKDDVIATLVAHYVLSIDFVDHFRSADRETDYNWEPRWVRDEGYGKLIPQAIAGVLAQAGLAAADVDALIIPITARGIAASVAKSAGIDPAAVRDNLADRLGEAGVAHALLMLSHAIEEAKPGQNILVTAFGSGCEAFLFRTTDALMDYRGGLGVAGWLGRRREETNYQKFLAHRDLVRLDSGMRAEFDQKQSLPALYRDRKTVLGLVGGRCTVTATVQFPKTDISVNPQQHAVHTQEDYPLAERVARIVTFTVDHLTFTLDPPAYYGLIDFEGGGRMMAEFCDVTARDVAVGKPVRMMFRIKNQDPQRGFTKYFWKAAPAFGPAGSER